MKKKKWPWIVLGIVLLWVVSIVISNDGETYTPPENNEIPESTEQIQETLPIVNYFGLVNVYDANSGAYIRSCEKVGDLSETSENEFYSFTLQISNNTADTYAWQEAYVCVDGGEPWYWTGGQLASGQSTDFHIAKGNMEQVYGQGVHTCVWYMDGEEVYRDTFMITRDMNWEKVFRLPTQEELAAYTNPLGYRSPYIFGWFYIPEGVRFTEFSIDFKADHVPRGTYCSLGNWKMDDRALRQKYSQVTDMQVCGYAGFQHIDTGEMGAIMSFWDVFCKDALGNEEVIRAKRVYPETTEHREDFWGEGTGAHCFVPYAWEANHWYRMYLRCTTSAVTGNTVVEQWVCDLETGEETLLCGYDIGYGDSAFVNWMGIFLENYITEEAGQVRSMEICNPRYLNEQTGQWCELTEIDISVSDDMEGIIYEGSYRYGLEEDRVWMITSGVGGNWRDNGTGQKSEHYTIGG